MTARTPRRLPVLLAILLSALALAGGLRDARAQTLDEILAKHYAARGGLEKIKAVNTVRMTGKMVMGGMNIEAPITIEQKRPMRMRIDFSFQGMNGTQAYDGTSGWQQMPFTGKPDPEAVSADDLKHLEEQADLDGMLVEWKAKGHQVELVGKEPVEGADAYKLKVTLKNGEVRYSYIDAEHFLEIKTEGQTTRMGGELEVESSIGDYKPVDGLMLPFSISSGAKGMPQKQTVSLEKIELNVPIDDARFTMPAPKAAASPNAPGEKAPAEKPKDEQKKG